MDQLFPPPPFPTAGHGTPGEAAPAPNQNHVASLGLPQPPYADMIYSAISALKERDGSSKRAITKYIEKEYSGILPVGYQESLTQHLKRLKNTGMLVMNKKSYMMPTTRSEVPSLFPASSVAVNGSYAAPAPAPPPTAVGFLQGLQLQQQQTGMMFPPGIPPNLFANPFQQQFMPGLAQASVQISGQAPPAPAPLADAADGSVGVKRGRGRPPKPKIAVHPGEDVQQAPQQWDGVGADVNDAAQPVFVALGLADDPSEMTKRQPGRPKKASVAGEGGGAAALPQQQLLIKRGRGRPPGKLGRPRKPKSLSAGGIKRGRGRPPKNPNQGPLTLGTVVDPAVPNVPRPRGRPRKGVVIPGVGGIMPMKRFGIPPRPRKSSGRPVGRPRKYGLLPNEAHRSRPQSDGYEDMRKKLEFFQSRIMHAVGVLKPEFGNESSSHDAIKAIQELEGLASVDIATPFIEDRQPPPAAATQQQQQQQQPGST